MFYKIGVIKNFAKFTEKQLCRSLFFTGLQARILQNFKITYNDSQNIWD